MKTLTRILSSFSLLLVLAFSARSQDVFKAAPIGIGTVNPAQALDVAGNVKFSGALMPNNLPGTAGNILLSGGAAPAWPTWLANGTSGYALTAGAAGVATWSNPYTNVWNLTGGNAISSTYGTNFLGTLNGSTTPQLEFKTTGVYSGVLDPVNDNVYFGFQVNGFNPGGDETTITSGVTDNVAIGSGSFGGLTASGDNIASGTTKNVYIGYVSGYNSSVTGGGIGSTGVGYGTLRNATGAPNTAFGFFAMRTSTSTSEAGSHDVAIGYENQYSYTSSTKNVGIGDLNLYSTTSGTNNTALGYHTLYTNSTGYDNTAAGYQAEYTNSTAKNQTGIGYEANYSFGADVVVANTNGNTAVGALSLFTNTTSIGATAIGTYTLHAMNENNASNPGSSSDVAIGDSSSANITGACATSIGANSFRTFPDALNSQMTCIGYGAGQAITGASQPQVTIIGYLAMSKTTTLPSYGTVALGANAIGGAASSGSANDAIGAAALYSLTSGASNIAIGSANSITNANFNAPLGELTTGGSDLAIGFSAAALLGTGSSNVAIGAFSSVTGVSSASLGSGSENTAIGTYATAGSKVAVVASLYNTALGYSASAGNTSVITYYATAVGANSVAAPTTGTTAATTATALGASASATANSAIAIGDGASASGLSSTALGAGSSASASNSTAIGANAVANTANTVILGGTGANAVFVGIGTSTPQQELEIGGAVNTINLPGIEKGNTFSAAPSTTTDEILFAKTTGDVEALPNRRNNRSFNGT